MPVVIQLDFLCLCLLYLTFLLAKCFSFNCSIYYELCCNLRRGQRLDADQVMLLRLSPCYCYVMFYITSR